MAKTATKHTLRFQPARSGPNTYRWLLWIVLILAGIWLILSLNRGEVTSPFAPTPTPTRAAQSYILEAQAYFQAGKLDDPNSENDAIDTYRKAVIVDPENVVVLAELARIQTYSSSLLNTDQERLKRLEEARDNINRAVEIDPDNSTVQAVRAFVLDWNASSNLISSDQREAYLIEAESAANKAYLLDPENALALAFYAEVLMDQQKWDQALEYAEQAVNRAPGSMDAHRVYGTVLESNGLYNAAIDEYIKASDISPNLTFLLMNIGLGYRNLANRAQTESQARALYDNALFYFDRAANINKQLGVKDPNPYIAIAKTYTQQGEFFIASRNAETALVYSPTSPDTYGQLGMIYVQARNYESALPALRCAVEGCTADENQTAIEFMEQGLLEQSYAVAPLELTNLNVAYYYIRYGSVLAYLSDQENQYCAKSLALMGRLRAIYGEDTLLMDNVAEVEGTCAFLTNTPNP